MFDYKSMSGGFGDGNYGLLVTLIVENVSFLTEYPTFFILFLKCEGARDDLVFCKL